MRKYYFFMAPFLLAMALSAGACDRIGNGTAPIVGTQTADVVCRASAGAIRSLTVARKAGQLSPKAIETINQHGPTVVRICTGDTPPDLLMVTSELAMAAAIVLSVEKEEVK